MNSASQNFRHHLGTLRERMLHPREYELAVNYFLEEFAGDVAFVRVSERSLGNPGSTSLPQGHSMEV